MSDELRALITRWRETADRSMLGPTQLTEYACKRLCANELEAALASPVEQVQNAELNRNLDYVDEIRAQAFEEVAKAVDTWYRFPIAYRDELATAIRALAQAKEKICPSCGLPMSDGNGCHMSEQQKKLPELLADLKRHTDAVILLAQVINREFQMDGAAQEKK